MSKTIWYINHYGGGPGVNPAYRAYELSRQWQNQGHNAHVFIGSYAGPKQEQPYPAYQLIDGVPYTAIPTKRYKSSGMDRLIAMFLFAWRVNFIPRHLPDGTPIPDAIIVSTVHPFPIFAGRRLARKYGAKLVFEIRDFWPLTFITLLQKSRWHPFIILCALTERYALKHADLITSVLPRAHLYFEDFKITVKDYAWTPMGVSKNETDGEGAKNQHSPEYRTAKKFIDRSHSENKIVVIYAGAMGPPNNLKGLISALEFGQASPASHQMTLLAIGEGVEREEIERRAKALPNVESHFTGQLSKNETQELLGFADIGYAGGNNIPKLYRYGIAYNKLASYLGAKLPVLLPLEPCGDPVSESGCGIVDGVQTPAEMWEHLNSMFAMGDKARKDMGGKGHAYLATHCSYPVIAKNYISKIFKTNS